MNLTWAVRRRDLILFMCFAWLGVALLSGCYSDRDVEVLSERFNRHYRATFSGTAGRPESLLSLSLILDTLQQLRTEAIAMDTHYLSTEAKQLRANLLADIDRACSQWLPFRQNPAMYNLAGLLKSQLVTEPVTGTDEDSRAQQLLLLMDQAEAYYGVARRSLAVQDPSLYRLAAQKQYLGLEFLRRELPDSLGAWSMTDERRRMMQEKIDRTYRSLKDYLAYCESAFLNHRDSTNYLKSTESVISTR